MHTEFDVDEWHSAEPTEKKGFSLKDADDLRATPMPQIQWAVPDILPEGLAILGGDPKIGKSWLALQLCGAIGGSGTFLGMVDVAYGHAVYLALEDPEWRVTARMNGMFGPASALPGLYCRTEMGPWGSGDWLDLSAWIESNRGLCRVVVVDTFARIKPPDEAGLNAYEAANKLGKTMLTWAHKHHVCLLLVHHKSKTTDGSDPVKSLSGSIGFAGSADTILLLSRTRTEREAKLFITGRDVGEREIDLTHDQNGMWLMHGATTRHERPKPEPTGPVGIVPPEAGFVREDCYTCGAAVKEKTEFGSVCRRCHPK
jgi:RecA-family ATPase